MISSGFEPIRCTASPTSLVSSQPARDGASIRISASAVPGRGGRPSAMRRTSSASIDSAAGQIATTAATLSLAAPAWIAISPPMLDPRAATRRSSTSGRAASHSASEAQVVDHRGVQVTLGLAVAAVVERERDKAVVRGGTGEVRVVLLA